MAEIESIKALKEIQEAFSKIEFWGNPGLEWVPRVQSYVATL
jgi:hypothetical protein